MSPRLLTRAGCGLCDEFADAWRAAFPGVDLPRFDVDRDAALRQRYGDTVPVLLDGADQPVCSVHFDHAACLPVARALGAAV
ncbi:glutaredoxin family protein [Algiphilus sp.]|uniref:glutaredoxin family protein n=1 Tax=Algiphilus sp. TaxID=1872431 RepID=UPI003C311A4F